MLCHIAVFAIGKTKQDKPSGLERWQIVTKHANAKSNNRQFTQHLLENTDLAETSITTRQRL